MSQYISSFLIDPVIRQARRLSRPSFTTSESDQHDASETTSTTTADNPRQYLSFRTPSFNLPSLLGTREAASTSSLPTHPLDSLPSSEVKGPLCLIEIANLEPNIPARQYTVRHVNANGHESKPMPPEDGEVTVPLAEIVAATATAPISEDGHPTSFNDQARNNLNDTRRASSTSGLPADDGMTGMRRRILAIQRTDSSHEVKARLVYDVMTESHNASSRARSPVSVQSSGRPVTPASPKSDDSLQPSASPPTSSSSAGETSNPYHLFVEDLIPTYWEDSLEDRDDAETGSILPDSQDASKALGCVHYKRNIKLQCSACQRWYPCRFCHDAVEDHMLNRRETKCMLCMLCGCAQPASESCVLCNHPAAWYYCNVCKLWDDHPRKEIYHCEECGICRIGAGVGKSHLHCKTCNVCMAISHFDRHRCVERSTECNCPICGEYLFTSPNGVVFMPCGHSIHRSCYSELMRATYRCPICSRSITNMERQFLDLRREIELQPMPEEFRDTKAWIHCNDCLAKTKVRYHWIGLECAVCRSFNTVQHSLLTGQSRSPSPSQAPSSSSTSGPSIGIATRNRRPTLDHRLRSALSLPTVNIFSASLAFPPLDRGHAVRARSLPPERPTDTASSEIVEGSSCSSDSEADDDYSDVEFWGGESPRLFSASPTTRGEEDVILTSDDESDQGDLEDEDSDECDEDMAIDEDEGEEEPGVLDQLEITGHR